MADRPKRIFQIAKELNISHTEIIVFLNDKGVKVSSHMAPVDDRDYQRVLVEFSKDKESIERYRKEQIRREIHDTRFRDTQRSTKKINLLSLADQRKLEKEEKFKAKKELKQKIAEKKAASELVDKKVAPETVKMEQPKKEDQKKLKKETTHTEVQPRPKTVKLRKINLTDIESEIGQGIRRTKPASTGSTAGVPEKSVEKRVRQTLAKIDTRSKKKIYKKGKESNDEAEDLSSKKVISVPEYSSVDELAKYFEVTPSEIIQKCLGLGVLATINQRLDWDMIQLLAEENNCAVEKLTEHGDELFPLEDTEEDLSKAKPRAPVITVMGHVDHGKTSLLDYIRNTNVVAGESGGITQHIGAYKVEQKNNKMITFLDTPGHEAFTAMRSRGAQITDIVILVVAADDSVMQQTIEAINHARAAQVPIVVAINKIDKPGADVEKVKRELSDNEILVEDWGGKVQSIEVSAKEGTGMDALIDGILLESEMLNLQSNFDCSAHGTVIESRIDRGLGPVATVLIQKGTLSVGDLFICNDYPGKVRAIINERGQRIKEAYPSDAIQILGFEKVPQAADILRVIQDEKKLKRLATDRQRLKREIEQKKTAVHSLDIISSMIKEGEINVLPLVIKGDVDGSIDALSETLQKLNTEEVNIKIIHKAVGPVSESDILLAQASNAVVIGFHVKESPNAKLLSKQTGVEVRTYNVIYQVVEEIKMALEGLLEPEKVEEIVGKAIVLEQFKIPQIGFIAGSKVTEGIIKRNGFARLIRDDEIISEGQQIASLKRFKDDAKEVKEGMECGIALKDVKKYKKDDVIEIYEIKEVKRKLESAAPV